MMPNLDTLLQFITKFKKAGPMFLNNEQFDHHLVA